MSAWHANVNAMVIKEPGFLIAGFLIVCGKQNIARYLEHSNLQSFCEEWYDVPVRARL